MKKKMIQVLLLEDNPGDARLFREYLHEADLIQVESDHVERLKTGLEHLAQRKPDVILLDLGLPDSQGLETFTQVYAQTPEVPIVILTGLDVADQAVEAVRAGAQDYLVKGEVSGALLVRAIRYAIERKQADAKLRESEERFRAMAETIPLAIYMTIGIEQKCEYLNPMFIKLFGYTLDIIPTVEQWWPLAYPDEEYRRQISEEWTRKIERAIETQTPIEPMEVVVTCKDGSRKNILWGYITLGEKSYAYGLNLTDRKRAEEELHTYSESLEAMVAERTQALRTAQEQLVRQEKLAVLGQMAGSVSHELRNPLAIISNAIYFLKIVQPDASDKIKEYLDIIEKETRNSDKIITDLLNFSRKTSVESKSVIVSELIRQTLERFPAPPPVQVALSLPADLPKVYADPRQMEQVLGNLVLNACQAMPDGGELTISAAVQNDMIGIAVQDTGVGILPENMSKLFEPLFTTKTKGIGLGLAVSRKLIEANGGKIEVESEAGKGSTFTFWLPVKP